MYCFNFNISNNTSSNPVSYPDTANYYTVQYILTNESNHESYITHNQNKRKYYEKTDLFEAKRPRYINPTQKGMALSKPTTISIFQNRFKPNFTRVTNSSNTQVERPSQKNSEPIFKNAANNEKLTSESALKIINCNDLKERKLSVLRAGKDSEIIFCVILSMIRRNSWQKKEPTLCRTGSSDLGLS